MEQNNNINNEWLNETKIQSEEVKQPADNYIGKIIDGKYEIRNLIGRSGFYTT